MPKVRYLNGSATSGGAGPCPLAGDNKKDSTRVECRQHCVMPVETIAYSLSLPAYCFDPGKRWNLIQWPVGAQYCSVALTSGDAASRSGDNGEPWRLACCI